MEYFFFEFVESNKENEGTLDGCINDSQKVYDGGNSFFSFLYPTNCKKQTKKLHTVFLTTFFWFFNKKKILKVFC